MLGCVQEEQIQAPFYWMLRNLTGLAGSDGPKEVLGELGILR